MSRMNICKNEENWTCGNIEIVVDNPLNTDFIDRKIVMIVLTASELWFL